MKSIVSVSISKWKIDVLHVKHVKIKKKGEKKTSEDRDRHIEKESEKLTDNNKSHYYYTATC